MTLIEVRAVEVDEEAPRSKEADGETKAIDLESIL
jgi:hypothetical protein